MRSATIRDVAKRSGVSVASVSRVLNGADTVTDAMRGRVLEAIDTLHYVPHSGARSLSTRRTDTLGVILPDLFGEYFSELIRGMDRAARVHGKHLIVSSSHDDAEEVALAMRSMRGRVDGLIVLSPHLDAARLAEGLVGSLPVVLMNAAAVGADRPCIVVDNDGGAAQAVAHLVQTGRRRIAHVRGPLGNLEADERVQGYLRALGDAGLGSRVEQGDFTQASGYRAVARMLAEPLRPDAVFAANDMMAVGAVLAIQEARLRCPEDVAVVGFDDVPIAELVRPALTTLRIDIAGTGARALERLITLIQAPATGAWPDSGREIVRPALVVRQSSVALQHQPERVTPRPEGRDQNLMGESHHA